MKSIKSIRLIVAVAALSAIVVVDATGQSQTLVQYDPTGSYDSCTTPFSPSTTSSLITASDITQTGFGCWFNTGVWPVGQVGSSAVLDPTIYLSFELSTAGSIQYETLSFSKQSYVGEGALEAAVRTSLDGFANDVDTVMGLDPAGYDQIVFDISSLAVTTGQVEFRVYFYAAPGVGADWVDLVSTGIGTGSGLIVTGTITMASIGTNYCVATANSNGTPGSTSAAGSVVAADNNIVLTGSSLPNQSFGFFLTSQSQGFVVMPGGSSGNLCLGGAIGRYVGPGQIQNSGASGEISLVLDLTMTPTPTGLVAVQAGETWNFTAWYRDAVGGVATSNFTDGLEIPFQ